MYDICHPTYYHMSQLGCNDQVKLTTAFYVYMELCEVKRYWDVQYKYSNELELFYLEARRSKTAKLNTFIPWPAFHSLTLDFISNIQHQLQKDIFTFVFKEGDTTSVYYSICSNIVKPVAPEETIVLKQKEEKKFSLEKEIRRNTANLYERALSLDNDDIKETEECSDIKNEKCDNDEFLTEDLKLNNSSGNEKIKSQKCISDDQNLLLESVNNSDNNQKS